MDPEIGKSQEIPQPGFENSQKSKSKKGFLDSVQKTFVNMTHGAERMFKDLGQKAERVSSKDLEHKWRTLFGLNEKLLTDYYCKCLENDRLNSGTLFISYHHLAFFAPALSNTPGVKITIPFSSITEMKQAAKLPSKQGNSIPAIVQLSANPELAPKVIQIFTRESHVYQFIFGTNTFNRAWTNTEHAYRSSPLLSTWSSTSLMGIPVSTVTHPNLPNYTAMSVPSIPPSYSEAQARGPFIQSGHVSPSPTLGQLPSQMLPVYSQTTVQGSFIPETLNREAPMGTSIIMEPSISPSPILTE